MDKVVITLMLVTFFILNCANTPPGTRPSFPQPQPQQSRPTIELMNWREAPYCNEMGTMVGPKYIENEQVIRSFKKFLSEEYPQSNKRIKFGSYIIQTSSPLRIKRYLQRKFDTEVNYTPQNTYTLYSFNYEGNQVTLWVYFLETPFSNEGHGQIYGYGFLYKN